MIKIKIQYDKYDRTFKLLDKGIASLLEDGDIYELIAPAVLERNDELQHLPQTGQEAVLAACPYNLQTLDVAAFPTAKRIGS